MGRGEKNSNWKGGRRTNSNGYMLVWEPTHPRADRDGYVFEHVLVLEKALGRLILSIEAVHHIDENRINNAIGNLMVFIDSRHHSAYHNRLDAFKVSGNWEWLKCQYCKNYDAPDNLYINYHNRNIYHRRCANLRYHLHK